MKRSAFSKYKPIALPVGAIIAVVVLALLSGNFLMGRINSIRAEMRRLESSNSVLAQRADTLQSVPFEITDSVTLASQALPPDTPAILATQQLKLLASEFEVSLERFTVTTRKGRDGEELMSSDINFEVSGEFQNLWNFLNSFGDLVPIINIGSIAVSSSQTVATAVVRLQAFSAPFPETLPSITEPIVDLSSAERDTLEFISSFRQPVVRSIPPAPPDQNRVNPFQLNI